MFVILMTNSTEDILPPLSPMNGGCFLFGSLGCLGRSLSGISHGSLSLIVVATNGAATLATGSLTLACGLGVYLLSLTLFETFGHSGANGVEDKLD